MQGRKKTKTQKTSEVVKMRQRITELESLETERKQTMETLHSDYEQLKVSEMLYRTLVDNMDLGISFIAADHTVLMASAAKAKQFNIHTVSDYIGKKCFRAFERRKTVCPHCPGVQAMATGQPAEVETEGVRTDGSRYYMRLQAFPVFGGDGTMAGFIEISENITDRKRVEKALRENAELYSFITDISMDGFAKLHLDGRILDVNEAYCQMLGYSKEELLKMTVADIEALATPDEIKKQAKKIMEVGIGRFETRHRRKDGCTIDVEVSMTLLRQSGHILVFLRDITERKRAEDLMQIQHELAVALSAEHDLNEGLRLCFDAAMRASGMDCGGIYLVDEISGALNLVFHKGLTPDFVRSVSHYDADSTNTQLVMAGKPIYTSHLDLEVSLDEVQRREGLLAIAVIPIHFEHRVIGCINISSHTFIEIASSTRGALKAIAAQIGSAIARLKSKEAFRMSRARFRDLVDLLPQSVFEIDNEGNFSFLNASGLKSFGYTQEDIDKGLSALQLTIPKERKRAEENLGKVLSGEKSIGNEYTVSRKDGSTFPVILYASPIIHEGETVGLRGIVIDITERKRFIEERFSNLERLRRSLEETISALSSTLEARDPYTAGHQKRVADLAVAIAEEMGLAGEQIDGIRMAGLVHDIGKVYVPSELLNKTRRLYGAEYELFKSHCQVGYDILKKIDFPWPVAPMVMQHHERQDGSGYPQGLYGGDIMLEARILAVADVVEAMSGHRPYRPAYSVGDALEEILHHKDALYDPDVVDACLRVFYDKGFAFKEEESAV